MAHAGSNSEGRLAVLCFQKRSRRGWIVSTISSKSLPLVESPGIPKKGFGREKENSPRWNIRLIHRYQTGRCKIVSANTPTSTAPNSTKMTTPPRTSKTLTPPKPRPPPDDQYELPPPDPTDTTIPASATSAIPDSQPPSSTTSPSTSRPATGSDTDRAQAAKQQVERDHGESMSESEEVVPKAAHDATAANAAK